jgi:hypothetical protein
VKLISPTNTKILNVNLSETLLRKKWSEREADISNEYENIECKFIRNFAKEDIYCYANTPNANISAKLFQNLLAGLWVTTDILATLFQTRLVGLRLTTKLSAKLSDVQLEALNCLHTKCT